MGGGDKKNGMHQAVIRHQTRTQRPPMNTSRRWPDESGKYTMGNNLARRKNHESLAILLCSAR